MNRYYSLLESPLQQILLISNGHALTGLYFVEHRYGPQVSPDWKQDDQIHPFPGAKEQLMAYFSGALHTFSIPMEPRGTPFQHLVWNTLQTIPYGTTITYQELAKRIHRPSSVRAVGSANAHNPISIIIPCHRVVGANGSLTGYGGGLERKAALLAMETAGRQT